MFVIGMQIEISKYFTVLTKVGTTELESQNLQVIPQLCAIEQALGR